MFSCFQDGPFLLVKPLLQKPTSPTKKGSARGFTIIEILVSTFILLIIMGITAVVTHQITLITSKTRQDIEGFQNARFALEAISRKLSQAVLNPYWDYYDEKGNRISDYKKQDPFTYGRYSELQFTCGPLSDYQFSSPTKSHGVFFQAPIGYTRDSDLEEMKGLLNVAGFYCAEYEDKIPFFFFKSRQRYALMEMVVPSEQANPYADIYQSSPTKASNFGWFTPFVSISSGQKYSYPVADNILSVIFLPHYPISEDVSTLRLEKGEPASFLTPEFHYDSRKRGPTPQGASLERQNGSERKASWLHQLPPLIDLYIIAMDETTAQKAENDPQLIPELFEGELFRRPEKLIKDLEKVTHLAKSRNLNLKWFKSTIILYSSSLSGE